MHLKSPNQKFRAIIIISFVAFHSVQAQNFVKTFGSGLSEEGRVIVPAFDGGFLFAGTINDLAAPSGYSYDILLVKTDSLGAQQWSRTINSIADDDCIWLERSVNQSYLLCGNTFDNSVNKNDMFVIRIDSGGGILSQNIYSVTNSERASCIRQTPDGGFILAGETVIAGTDLQLYIMKADSTGQVEWSHAYGDSEQQTASYILQTSDRGYLVAGISRYGLSWSSIFLVKVDSMGAFSWAKKYNTDPYLSRCGVSKVIEAANGDMIVNGTTTANQPLSSVFVMKITANGTILWQKLYSTGRGERNSDMIDEENGYVICGSTATASGADNALLMKIDDTGNLVWDLAYGVPDSNMIAESLLKIGDHYYFTGSTDTYGAGESDILFVRSDSLLDYSLCNMIQPAIVQDTVTLVATSSNLSNVIITTKLAGNFTTGIGVQENPVCQQTVGVNYLQAEPEISLSPNPLTGQSILTVNLKKPALVSIELIDLVGKKLSQHSHSFLNTVHHFEISAIADNGSSISNGLYLCLISIDGYIYKRQLVINR